jgi:transcriptional regulator with XRE-family HTH domain
MAITNLDIRYANELKVQRKKYKFSQNKMVEYLELGTQQQYSDLENGKKHFTDSIVLKICNIFNISILQFINNCENDSTLSYFLNKKNYDILENSDDNEIKITLYRKLLIEAKIETTELKLKLLHKDFNFKALAKNKTHVII